jgi:hypothetical protein
MCLAVQSWYATYHTPNGISTQIVPGDMIKWRVMKEPCDRLRELRIKKGFETAVDAARRFGWNENVYKSHENGVRGIKPHVAKKYALAFKSTASYILTGDNHAPVVQEVVSVALRGIVAAGMFKPNDWVPEDHTKVPAVIRNGIPPQKQYAVLVDGPSVNLRIPDGSYAICADFDSYPGGAASGSLVHAVRERRGEVEHTLKEIRFTPNGAMLFPVSDHPDHQTPLQIGNIDGETVSIVGVVIGSYKPF